MKIVKSKDMDGFLSNHFYSVKRFKRDLAAFLKEKYGYEKVLMAAISKTDLVVDIMINDTYIQKLSGFNAKLKAAKEILKNDKDIKKVNVEFTNGLKKDFYIVLG